MRLPRFVLCCALVASFGRLSIPNPVVTLSGLSSGASVNSTLRPGMVLSRHGIALRVPQPGHGVGAEALLAGGGEVDVSVRTSNDGKVTVRDDSTTPGLQLQATTTTNPCLDGAYALYGVKWAKSYAWSFQASSTPSMSQSSAATTLKSAANHITSGYNSCGLADNIGATNSYLGTTSTGSGISTSAGCTGTDGKNVVSFGTLPNGYLGMTCWWSMSSTTFEADVKLNKAYYQWYMSKPSVCAATWSVNAAATHEFGHVFGLAHVSETYHPTLTMSTTIWACQGSESTLGLGDVKGLNSLY
jgi:Matrixin